MRNATDRVNAIIKAVNKATFTYNVKLPSAWYEANRKVDNLLGAIDMVTSNDAFALAVREGADLADVLTVKLAAQTGPVALAKVKEAGMSALYPEVAEALRVTVPVLYNAAATVFNDAAQRLVEAHELTRGLSERDVMTGSAKVRQAYVDKPMLMQTVKDAANDLHEIFQLLNSGTKHLESFGLVSDLDGLDTGTIRQAWAAWEARDWTSLLALGVKLHAVPYAKAAIDRPLPAREGRAVRTGLGARNLYFDTIDNKYYDHPTVGAVVSV